MRCAISHFPFRIPKARPLHAPRNMPTRRQVVVGGSAALVLMSCGPGAPPLPEGAVRVPISALPDGTTVVVMRVDEPVEVRRTGTSVVARSLFCPHFGCRLSWVAAANRYQCPCHGGAFDADGRPVAGPPTEPMRSLPASVQGEYVVIERRRR